MRIGLYAPKIVQCIDERMLAFAGLAMFFPASGRTCNWFHDEMLEDERMACFVESLVVKACDEKQLTIRLQPVFECRRDGSVVAAEALVRWHYPEFGEMMPSLFLPIVERLSLTEKVDLHVLAEVCAFQRKRIDQGAKTVPVAVNLSRDDMVLHRDFADRAIKLVDAHQLQHSLVQFELVESALAVGERSDLHYGAIKSQIEQFRAQGFKVLIDDYGAGMSNIKTIYSVPFDALKIDKFVVDGCEDPVLSCVLRHLVSCMVELGRDVIAEGVESERQLDVLESLGCSHIQGFYRSRPLKLCDFANLLDGK